MTPPVVYAPRLSVRLSFVLVAVLVLSPIAAAAQWGAKGFHEPSTPQDTMGGFMPLTASTDKTKNYVYFNGWLAQGRGPAVECATTNTWIVNIVLRCDGGGCPLIVGGGVECPATSIALADGATGVSYVPANPQPMALLGTWRDCNKDGYIGYGDLGLWEYRDELLRGDHSVCPVEQEPRILPPGWTPTHNDGTWVREFLPIGWDDWRQDFNKWNLNDSGSRVWADWGRPGEATPLTCKIEPVPPGTLRSTGGLVEWGDCADDYAVTDAFDAFAASRGHPELGFNDSSRDQSRSTSALNIRNPWGESNDSAYAEMWDCNKNEVPLPHVEPVQGDPSNGLVYSWNNSLKQPQTPPKIHTNGSASGQLREAYYGLPFERCTHTGEAGLQHLIAEAPYYAETASTNLGGIRDASDFAFHPIEGVRPTPLIGTTIGRSTPQDLGTRQATTEGLWAGSFTSAFSHTPLTRGTSLGSTTWITYYGIVSPPAVDHYFLTLPGNAEAYGAAACTSGIFPGASPENGWTCDPDLWWPGGEPTTNRLDAGPVPYSVRVGVQYNMRDVDCYDNSVAAAHDRLVGVIALCPKWTDPIG